MQKTFSISVNNFSVKGILENPGSRKLVILVHGFTGDLRGPNNIFEKLSDKMQQLDYAVMRFSFRGAPPSGGDYIDMTVDEQVADLRKVVEYARSLGYSDIALLGESMGGAIVGKAYDSQVKAVIFWYPAFDFADCLFKDFLTTESQQTLAERGYLLSDDFKVGKRFVDEIPNVDLYSKVGEITCPVLFLHGDADTDVPSRQSERAYQIAHAPKEIHIIKGADHCFEYEQTEVIDLTATFIKKFF